MLFSLSTLDLKLENGILTVSSGGDLISGNISSQFNVNLIEKVIFNTSSDTKIQSNAFINCINLKSCEFSKHITFISPDAFAFCLSLEEISIDNDNKHFSVNNNVLYSNDMKKIYKVPINTTEFNIFPSVTTIEGYSFHGIKEMNRLFIPKNVSEINYCAFFDSTINVIEFEQNSSLENLTGHSFSHCNIQQIVLSNTLREIQSYAFNENPKLFNITFLTSRSNKLLICSNAISNTAIRSFTIPANTELQAYALNPSHSLTDVTISDNVDLQIDCFAGCPYILNFHYSNSSDISINGGFLIQNNILLYVLEITSNNFELSSLNSFSNLSFQYSHNLTQLTNKNNNNNPNFIIDDSVIYDIKGSQIISAAGGLENITLGPNVTVLGNYCFSYMTKLKTLTINSNIDSINEKAFYRCQIQEIHFKHVKTIGIGAFQECDASNITFESGPVFISAYAFKNCSILNIVFKQTNTIETQAFSFSNLRTIEFDDSCNVTTIGESAFEGCFSLTSVKFHSKIKELSKKAFSNCIRLFSITIPSESSKLTIGPQCFYRCNFSSFTIDSKFYKISSLAFSECLNLREVTFSDAIPEIVEGGIFSFCNNLAKISLKNIDFIKNKDRFDKIISDVRSNIKEIYSNCESLPLGLFSNFYGLQNVTIATKIISESLFENCTNLRTVKNIKQVMYTVESRGFYNCQNLDFRFLKEVESIREYGFYGCRFPYSIVLPNNIQDISNYAFSNTGIKLVNFCSNKIACNNSFDRYVKAFVTESFDQELFCSLETTKIDNSTCQMPQKTNSFQIIFEKRRILRR